MIKSSKLIGGYFFMFFLGVVLAFYYFKSTNKHQCPVPIKCPVGFATLEEMSFLVEELLQCKENQK